MAVALWLVLIGFIAGMLARFVMPGPNNPKGFLLTTFLGVLGALIATLVGDATGLYRAGQGAGLIGATIGAIIILLIWHWLVSANIIRDHGL